jgi:hypothetical protein
MTDHVPTPQPAPDRASTAVPEALTPEQERVLALTGYLMDHIQARNHLKARELLAGGAR